MGVQIQMPQGGQQTSMGRRLLAMAAPIAGGALGGPAGAALGGVIGSKVSGGSTQDALSAGLKSGIMYAATPAKKDELVGTLNTSPEVQNAIDSPFSRKTEMLGQNPVKSINDGLDVVAQLPIDHPIRQQLTPAFIMAKMRAEGVA